MSQTKVTQPERARRVAKEKANALLGARVLVTGASGFLGQYVMATLSSAGAEGIALDRKLSDLRNEAEVFQAVLYYHPDIIVHLAGVVGGLGANVGMPGTFFRDNMTMGMNIVHAAAVGKVKLVTVGTASSYPKECPVPFEEESFWNGEPDVLKAPYGMAKKALLVMLQAYHRQFRLPFTYLVPANLYGPLDRFEEGRAHVIPALIEQFSQAKEAGMKEVVCWGSGQATRSFLFANDAAQAIATACGAPDFDDIINLPGTDEIRIADLAALIAKMVGYEGKILWDEMKPEGHPRRALAGARAQKLLGWQPTTTLEEGLRMTVEWYQETKKRGK